MSQSTRHHQSRTIRPLLDEADIGSGEKNPGQKETEEIIRQIPPLPVSERPAFPAPAKPGAPQS